MITDDGVKAIVGFYSQVASGCVDGRWERDQVPAIVQSFERVFGRVLDGFLCGTPGVGGIERSWGSEEVRWVGQLDPELCAADGSGVVRLSCENSAGVSGFNAGRVGRGDPVGEPSGSGVLGRVDQDGVDVVNVVGRGSGAGQVRGPNFERNRANRVAQKKRKVLRKLEGRDWRSGRKPLVGRVESCGRDTKCSVEAVQTVDSRKVESGLVRDSGRFGDSEKGFWNSCSDGVRQELIDSKARMHIAENERREREAREKIAAMESPMAMVTKVMEMVKLTEVAARKANDSAVAGWARTVAQSQSESLARSAPNTVQSFESFVDSSASSVPIEIHGEVVNQLDAERDARESEKKEAKKKQEELEKQLQDFRLRSQAEKVASERRFQQEIQRTIERLEGGQVGRVAGVKVDSRSEKARVFEAEKNKLELIMRRGGVFNGDDFDKAVVGLRRKIYS